MNNTSQYRGNYLKKDIYVIKNRINDKVYVGQAIDAGKRFLTHCKHNSASANSLIDRAIQKYGANNFWYEILESQIENYNEREKYWIKKLNSLKPNGYNIQEGGEDPPHYFNINHPLSPFNTEEEVKEVKRLLKETSLSLKEIGEKCGISKRTVMRINQGIHYESLDETYPIRAVPLPNGKLTQEDIEDIIEILKHTYRQYEDIAAQYKVSLSTIKQINSGDVHKQDKEDYPIRKYKNSGKPTCTYQQVTEISELLLKTNVSCRQIAKIYNVDLQTIYIINNGNAKRYKRPEYHYPIRKHNPKK